MHGVDRGPEPPGLAKAARKYTQRWVEYYDHGRGDKPSDDHWRKFHTNVREAFFGLCAYCEEICRGEVEHFRPKSKFPDRVYKWSNWLLACHDCNHAKGEKWPRGGYVDPCSRTRKGRPELFFRFDTLTGEIIPASGVTQSQVNKAKRMIKDLKLNELHHLEKRLGWLEVIRAYLRDCVGDEDRVLDFIEEFTRRERELSSITRVILTERGYLAADT